MKVRFGGSTPILSVRDMAASVRYYVDVLGFKNADWGSDEFTMVTRDRASIPAPPGLRPWAWEMQVEDPDGHVLRLGSDPDGGEDDLAR